MHKIDTASAASTKPAKKTPEGTAGYFEDNASGISTKVDADFLNSVQDEICNVIAAAGITLSKADDTQLLAAFLALVAVPTGTVRAQLGSTTPDVGWILYNDASIGKTGSGASNRANDDTSALYTRLWTNYTNAICPVSSGRGVSAAADFAAGKTLTLPPGAGRVIGVMGSGSGLSTRTNGQGVGAETVGLVEANNGPHVHPSSMDVQGTHVHAGSYADLAGDHFHLIGAEVHYNPYGGGNFINNRDLPPGSIPTYTFENTSTDGAHYHTLVMAADGNHYHNMTNPSSGSGTPHANVQPTIFVPHFIKL